MKKESVMDNGMIMHEIIANQVSVNEQDEARAALEAKYNSAEEAIEQDLLRAQFDGVCEEDVEQDMLAAQINAVKNAVEDTPELSTELEDDSDDWGSVYDNPYYNDNLDQDQQSPEFWDNL